MYQTRGARHGIGAMTMEKSITISTTAASTPRILTPVMAEDVTTMRASVSPRNAKMGNIPSFSVLPGMHLCTKKGDKVTDVMGTCREALKRGRCDLHCYACRMVKRYPSTAVAYARNTRLIREAPESAKRQILAAIDYYDRPLFRFHVGGELETWMQADVYAEIAAARPDVQFAIWTHCDPVLFFPEVIPQNLRIIKSIDHFPTLYDLEYSKIQGYSLFVYDDGTDERMQALKHCPNVTKEGHHVAITCDKCRKCWHLEAGEVVAVYAH